MLSVFKSDRTLYKQLATTALPIAAQNLIVYSLSVMDIVFLGFVGEKEIAAVTLANAPFFAIMLMIFGFQSGSSVLINQYWGKGDTKTISRVIGIAFFTALSLAFMASCASFFFPMQIMSFFTPDHELQALAAVYMKIVAFSYTINIFTQVYVGAMRSMNNAKVGMYVSAVAMIGNIILNWVFIFGNLGAPKMGVAGAALGTLLARIIELGVIIVYACVNKHFRLNLAAAVSPGKELTLDFFRYAGPVVINETLWGVGTSMYPAIYGRLGLNVVAAYSIATNMEKIFNVCGSGIGNASGVIVGKEIGAGRYEKASEYSRTLLWLTATIGIFTAAILFLCSPYIVDLLNISPATKTLAFSIITIYIFRFPLSAFNFASIVGILRAGGDTKTALMIDLSSLWLVGVAGTAFLAFVVKPPVLMIFIPLFLDELYKMILSGKRIHSGLWINDLTRSID